MSKRDSKAKGEQRLYCVRDQTSRQLIKTAAGVVATFPSKYAAKLGRDAYERRSGRSAVVVLGPDHHRAGDHEAA